MDPHSATDRAELQTRIKRSWDEQRQFREKRETLVRDYVGSYYGDNRPDQEILLNTLQIAAKTVTMRLTANRPQVQVSTHFLELETFAKRFQARVNNVVEEVRLEETLEKVALDGFFGLGIVKVSLAPIGPVPWNGTLVDPGKPFAERISLDDFVFEAGIPEWSKIGFAADLFELPLDDLRGNPDYDQQAVAELSAERHPSELDGESRARDISNRREDQPSKLREGMVRLMEVYLPPMLPHIEPQGGHLDMQELVETLAEQLDLPRIKHWLRFDGCGPRFGLQAAGRASRVWGYRPSCGGGLRIMTLWRQLVGRGGNRRMGDGARN